MVKVHPYYLEQASQKYGLIVTVSYFKYCDEHYLRFNKIVSLVKLSRLIIGVYSRLKIKWCIFIGPSLFSIVCKLSY